MEESLAHPTVKDDLPVVFLQSLAVTSVCHAWGCALTYPSTELMLSPEASLRPLSLVAVI
jgi:hypothetical protein